MKKIITAKEAAALVKDGMSVMFGGFTGCGAALDVIEAMDSSEVKDIHAIINDSALLNGADGSEHYAWARLIHSGKMTEYIGSHLGTNPEASQLWAEGKLKVTLVPQGSLAEMIRAGGCGLGGVLTPTGVGTIVEDSPLVYQKMELNGKDYLLMKPLRADVAIISACKADKAGNLWYKGTTKNFNTLMAMAADTVIAEVEELVEVGEIEPENVATSGILVDYLVIRGTK
ncbi:MAG: 3-oxoacid CoA-transferase subunit A [Clostridia bacterium]|nr:3-oxoacid CoA-transferase subunit A [Clostridia bacterium]